MSVILALLLASAMDFEQCARCHDESGWRNARFDHDQTRLPLRGRHAQASCAACHRDLHRIAADPRCQSCHRDVHAGRLGAGCARCHDAESFQSGAGAVAHAASRFPLLGRHAMVPCETCHQDRSDRSMGGVPRTCANCHARDAERTAGTGVDHAPLRDPDCRRCHTPVTFSRALFPDHEQCFPIAAGHHQRVPCYRCHTALRGLGVDQCTSFTASCTRCHHCNGMDRAHGEERVAGYQCADRKCYECHPDGNSTGGGARR